MFEKFFNQTRKPEGFLGNMMVSSMNAGHAKMAAWGMGLLPRLEIRAAADLGCGGGSNLAALLKRYPEAEVLGADYSQVSVDRAGKKNAGEIAGGRCRVIRADVSALPLEAEKFDLATAFETVYFWPGPLESFREVFRILRPEGRFLIVNECDGTNPQDQKWLDIVEGMTIYPEKEMEGYLRQAGFGEVEIFHNEKKHWVAYLARKK